MTLEKGKYLSGTPEEHLELINNLFKVDGALGGRHTNRTYTEMLECERAYRNDDISKQLYHATLGHWPNETDVKKKKSVEEKLHDTLFDLMQCFNGKISISVDGESFRRFTSAYASVGNLCGLFYKYDCEVHTLGPVTIRPRKIKEN